MIKIRYSIFTDTLCSGIVPIEHDELGAWVVYERKVEAQNEILDVYLEYQRQFFAGERTFEDAMIVEHCIQKVDLLPDGAIRDAAGRVYQAIAGG